MVQERATIFHNTIVGVETVYGVQVPATKMFQALGFMFKPNLDIQRFRPAGTKFDTTTAMNREWTEGKASGAISYEEIIYPFSSLLSAAVTTGPVGTEYTHVFSMRSGSPDNARSFTVEQGGGPRAHRVTGVKFNDLTLKFTRSSIELDGSAFGQALLDGISMTGGEVVTLSPSGTWTTGTWTLTYGGATTSPGLSVTATAAQVQAALEALPTIGPGNVAVTGGPIPTTPLVVTFQGALGGTDAGVITSNVTGVTPSPTLGIVVTTPGTTATTLALIPVAATHVTVETHPSGAFGGATVLARAISAEWSVTNRFGRLFVLDGLTTYVNTVETVPQVQAKLLLEANAEGMAFLAAARANTSKFIRIKATGPTIATNPYLLQLDIAGRVTDVGEFTDSDGVYALEFTFTGVNDGLLGGATKATVRNTLATL